MENCWLLQIYQYVAGWLTDLELHRTQTEHDDAFSLKIYLLQFVNYYASIFYIAFAKGNFVGYPGNYNRLLGRENSHSSQTLPCPPSKFKTCTE